MNYREGKLIIIGKGKTSKGGVMFHETGITFAEAKRYDPDLTESEYNKLLGIKEPKKEVKEPKKAVKKGNQKPNKTILLDD